MFTKILTMKITYSLR